VLTLAVLGLLRLALAGASAAREPAPWG
jgi:hypothetical protein